MAASLSLNQLKIVALNTRKPLAWSRPLELEVLRQLNSRIQGSNSNSSIRQACLSLVEYLLPNSSWTSLFRTSRLKTNNSCSDTISSNKMQLPSSRTLSTWTTLSKYRCHSQIYKPPTITWLLEEVTPKSKEGAADSILLASFHPKTWQDT